MEELIINWEEFVEKYKDKKVNPWVDLNKGHVIMKSQFAPNNWRTSIRVLTFLTIISFPLAILLFFFITWWIPVLILILAFMFTKAIRQEAAKAVIETSLYDPSFYSHALLTGTMKIYPNN